MPQVCFRAKKQKITIEKKLLNSFIEIVFVLYYSNQLILIVNWRLVRKENKLIN